MQLNCAVAIKRVKKEIISSYSIEELGVVAKERYNSSVQVSELIVLQIYKLFEMLNQLELLTIGGLSKEYECINILVSNNDTISALTGKKFKFKNEASFRASNDIKQLLTVGLSSCPLKLVLTPTKDNPAFYPLSRFEPSKVSPLYKELASYVFKSEGTNPVVRSPRSRRAKQ
jgi:hypothetical protein